MVSSSWTLKWHPVPTKLNPGKLARRRTAEGLVCPPDVTLPLRVETSEGSAAADLNLDAAQVAGDGWPPKRVNRLARIGVV